MLSDEGDSLSGGHTVQQRMGNRDVGASVAATSARFEPFAGQGSGSTAARSGTFWDFTTIVGRCSRGSSKDETPTPNRGESREARLGISLKARQTTCLQFRYRP